jgi:hypothetical protein
VRLDRTANLCFATQNSSSDRWPARGQREEYMRARSSSPPQIQPTPSSAGRGSQSPPFNLPMQSPVGPISPNGAARKGSPLRDPSIRSTSAPPAPLRSNNHTPKRRPMHFADKPPGSGFRHSPEKRNRSARMASTNVWGSVHLAESPIVMDTTQSIRAWLHQQVQYAQLGEGDVGIEANTEEGQPSSPKLLSARSPIATHIDSGNETDGWIISPVPPSSVSKSLAWPRSRHDRSDPRRSHVLDTSSDTSSDEGRHRRTSPSPAAKGASFRLQHGGTSRGNSYQVEEGKGEEEDEEEEGRRKGFPGQ